MAGSPKVAALDHLVLTVADLDRTVAFYTQVLGMERVAFQGADGVARVALSFGSQKINLHVAGAEIKPHAKTPVMGSADLCFLTETPLEDWQTHFAAHDIVTESDIVARTGATGPIRSIYLRDPDGNLIEVSNQA